MSARGPRMMSNNKGDSLKKLLALLGTLVMVVLGITPAQAVVDDQTVYDETGEARDIINYLDITGLTYGENAARPGVHYFTISTNGPIPADGLNDGYDSWAGIFFDVNFDGVDDYRMEVKNWNVGSRAVPARVLYEADFSLVPGCTATAYVLPGAWNITFILDYDCLRLPRTFRALGYTDYAPEYFEDSYDYVPETGHGEFTHSYSNLVGARRALDKPSVTNEVAFRTASPSAANSKVLGQSEDALVTVYCSDYVGMGFAVNASIPANVQKDGFKSYILTTFSNVSACLDAGKVRVSTSAYENYTGYLSVWDAANDLAGLYIEKQLPTLSIRGEKPAKNWWLASTGSEIVDEDISLTGKLSANPINNWNFTETTMRATANTYGAPVMDRAGRVVGLISTVDPSLFATMVNISAICDTVMSCSKNKVWISGLKNAPAVKTYANCSAMNRDYPGGVAQSIGKFNKGSKPKNQHIVSSAVYAKNKKLDTDKDGIACEK